MTQGASDTHVAVVGAGPAGFFAADALLKQPGIRVDVFERLPAPFGLVRYGVAPDHQKIKSVEAGFVKTGRHERLRYFGNVTIGRDISANELAQAYDQVVYAMGCEAPRPLGVPGEQLPGVHSALSFVSWYNGHPDYVALPVNLDVNHVAIVGAGDVSLDLCRLLASSAEELAETDMPDYALEEFGKKHIEAITILVRRGPGNAGFALKELKALLSRDNVAPNCDLELLQAAIDDPESDKAQRAKLEYLRDCCKESQNGNAAGKIRLTFRFLSSPSEFAAGDDGRLASIRVEKNRLETTADGRTNAVGTGQHDQLDAELALLAVGYRGRHLDGLHFDRRGLLANRDGQVLTEAGDPTDNVYVVGWLKRGPQGVIGTNKGDAKATVATMLERLPESPKPAPRTAELLAERGVRYLTFEDWLRLDEMERERGRAVGKPRVKLTNLEQTLAALGEQ